MANVRAGLCATCGAHVLWLRSFGFGDPRPIDRGAVDDGDIVIDTEEGRYRHLLENERTTSRRYRLHWPCPTVSSPRARATPSSAVPKPTARSVRVVAHTHWDREWYEPFEAFRTRLIDVVDEVLDVLEADDAFTAFHLDGQTAMIDDYLEVRPGNETRVRALVRAGRLTVGPWETLVDEFLISGETLVRDLQRGMRRASELGGVHRVGYLPDQFGHIAQLPQLLALAGIETVLVYRGVPDEVARTAFTWEGIDGTNTHAEFLPAGYCNAVRLEDDAKRLVDRVRDAEATLGDDLVGDLLLMNGCDHLPLKPWVPAVLARANALQDDYRFTIGRLDDHLSRQPRDGLPTWRGELRAPGPATVTPGVLSNRVDVRLATAAAERALERGAEPLCALHLASDRWPDDELHLAWTNLVRNAAHDSIAACSADAVVRAVLLRADDARIIGDRLAARAVRALADTVSAPPGSPLVVNGAARRRGGPIELTVVGRGACHLVSASGASCPAQVTGVAEAVELDVTAGGRDLDAIVDLIGPDRAAGHRIAAWSASSGDATPLFMLHIAGDDEPAEDLGPLVDAVTDWRRRHGDQPARVLLLHPPVRHVLASSPPVDGLGWSALRVVEGEAPATSVSGGDRWIANEHVRVDVDQRDGTFTLTTVDGLVATGLGRLVDGGDAGDVYNYSPPIADCLVDEPDDVAVETLETGPVRARLAVTRSYRWPADIDRTSDESARSASVKHVHVRTVIDVVTDDPAVRVTVELDNVSADHRLRLHLPLPASVISSDAECSYAVVRRPLRVTGNALEAGLATFPSKRFVDCSDGRAGLAVVHDGVGEYEVVDDGRELAFTLLRSTGWLSRDDGRYRAGHAGPAHALADAQVQGPYRRRLALLLHAGDWRSAHLADVATDVLSPLLVTDVTGRAPSLPPAGGRLEVRGADVTAVTRRDRALEVRVVRLAPERGAVDVVVDGHAAHGDMVDLHGDVIAPFQSPFELDGWRVATLRIDAP